MSDQLRRADDDATPVAHGVRFRTEARGPAVIHCVGDRMDAVLNCLLPDGSRGTVCRTRPIEHLEGRWRRPLTDGSWQVGSVDISTDDVRFIDGTELPKHDEQGDWILDERGRQIWKGPLSWDMAHGPAIVAYMQKDRATTVFSCLLPDGARGTVVSAMEKDVAGRRRWRRPLPDGSWRDGDIVIHDDDVRFVEDLPRPPRALGLRSSEEAPDLWADMMASPRIAELVMDDRFAEDLYRALCNTSWFRNGHEWGCTWRQAGGVVANLRDLNEDYIDFYCSGREGIVTDEIAGELAALGWTWKPYEGGCRMREGSR